MKDNGRKTTPLRKQRCMQPPEMEDCFARSRQGNCCALADTDYPCGHCPFYKPLMVRGTECKRTYQHLISIGRLDLIEKYSVLE